METQKAILIVEDNTVSRTVLDGILRREKYRLLHAENGKQAFDMINSGEQRIDLILLDLVMPVMDGFEFLRLMNETGLLSSIPVIVITSSDEADIETRCLKEGASDFLTKPYIEQLVRHRVKSILRLWDNAVRSYYSEYDSLTGIYNMKSFYAHAEEALLKHPDDAFIMLYMDIEDFKLINAHYGKSVGDELLRYVAQFLLKIAGSDSVCGRLAADNFVLLMKNAYSATQYEMGKFYTDAFKDAPVKGVSLKCGVYAVSDRTIQIADMCDRAKIAEESVKHQYGVYYAIYDDSMRERALRDHQLVNSMEEALEKHQFTVYFQPKHSTETRAITGAEALVRWIHPELGFISPGEFIPLFEKNGFIAKLDCYVWNEVCATLRRWIDIGLRPVPISVNASRADFLTEDVPERIAELVENYDIPPELIHIEITESAYTDNPSKIISAVSVLRDMGFKIEMDDFGSGYSSLNMLSEMPIDILKLDMRFMQTGNDRLKASKRNILSFIVSLSKWLQLPTVAEGVESNEEFEVLKSMGCDYIQGYYFSRPMPEDKFEAYISEHSGVGVQAVPEVHCAAQQFHEPSGKEKPLVLVVEDIQSNRDVMIALLSSKYRIAMAQNGEEAYAYIKAHHNEIACILLDLLMPVMDGFQLLEILHKEKTYADIPIIITTETGSNGELRALNLGAHSFVAKPYNPDVLRHHVLKAVEEQRYLKIIRGYEKNHSGSV